MNIAAYCQASTDKEFQRMPADAEKGLFGIRSGEKC